MTFEKRLARLEEIAARMEAQEIELGAALQLFEEGVDELRHAMEELRGVEGKVKLLVEKLDGTFELADFRP